MGKQSTFWLIFLNVTCFNGSGSLGPLHTQMGTFLLILPIVKDLLMGKLVIWGICIHILQYGFFHNSLKNKKSSVFLQITHHLPSFLRSILSCTQGASHSTYFSCMSLVGCFHFSLMLRTLKKRLHAPISHIHKSLSMTFVVFPSP